MLLASGTFAFFCFGNLNHGLSAHALAVCVPWVACLLVKLKCGGDLKVHISISAFFVDAKLPILTLAL